MKKSKLNHSKNLTNIAQLQNNKNFEYLKTYHSFHLVDPSNFIYWFTRS